MAASTDIASTSYTRQSSTRRPTLKARGYSEPPDKPFVLHSPSICEYCSAKIFKGETASFCCGGGAVRLASSYVPKELRLLYLSNDAASQNFRQYILLYNSSFAFMSFGVKKDHEPAQRNRGIYTFRVQGQTYHFINDILPTEEIPLYIQLYFFDTETELRHRLQISAELQQTVVRSLMRVMSKNPYARFFRYLRDVGVSSESRIVIRSDPMYDQRTHNAPTTSQVAAIWIEDEHGAEPITHDIIVYALSGTSHRILHYYGCYDPLRYPLLFPNGDTGWHRGIYKFTSARHQRFNCPTFPISDVLVQDAADLVHVESDVAQTSETDRKVSCRSYYCYKLQIRRNDTSILLQSGRLFQQYVVDMYIKIESTRLDYIRNNQTDLRADLYQGIVDSHHAGETNSSNIGRNFILPGSFIGCERDMRRRYLNSMTVVQRYGKPDIFLTITCNPRWIEIEGELLPCEEAQNRPDLVSRIFRAKLLELKKDIIQKKLFGNVAGFVYVVEFQKRGLPHAHFLIILDAESKIRSPDQYDRFVCAEIPCASENPHLHAAVLRHMMHGPCGLANPKNSCMRDSLCKNRYSHDFADMTTNGRNSYPIYRRRNDGRCAQIRGTQLDNKWVVPYNPYLLAKHDCHFNVEVCSTIKAVKYLYKYVYKGHDRVSFIAVDAGRQPIIDEITSYQSGRWISPPEGAWRIFGFSLNEVHPYVIPLHVHLPNMQTVTFRSYEDVDRVVTDPARSRTMLTAYFDRNRIDQYARTLFYHEFPEHYVWHDKKK